MSFLERETYRKGFTLLTNFDKEKLSIYREAIYKYQNVSHDKYNLHIMDASNIHCDYGLWYSKKSKTHDLSDFWRMFEEIEKNFKKPDKEIFVNGHKYILAE